MKAKLIPAVTAALLLCPALFAVPPAAGTPAGKAAGSTAGKSVPAAAAKPAADKNAAQAEDPSCPVLDLSTIKPSKVTVLGGAALAEAVRSESGFMIPIEGKILYAFDGEGNVAWTHGLSSKVDSLSAGLGGILYAGSRKTTLCMISPGGKELWKTRIGFSMEGNPLPGRDGRVFVRSSSDIACYGLKGTRRWAIQVPGQDTRLPLTELNDGRLLVFLTKTEGGKSCALTVSPFGQPMEELTFSGQVKAAAACGDGVLLSFSDGAIGLCSVQGGKSVSSWIRAAAETHFSSSAVIIPELFSGRTAAFLSGSPARLLYVNTQTGTIEAEAKTGLNATALRYTGFTAQGLALADSSEAECYASDALPVWKARYKNAASWSYMFISDEGFIHFCGKDWVISSYRVRQSLSKGQVSSFKGKKASQYYAFCANNQLASSDVYGRNIPSSLSLEMLAAWKTGDFGEQEQHYLSLLTNEINAVNMAYSAASSSRATGETSYFVTHPAYSQELLTLAAASQLATFSPVIARLLVKTSGTPLTLTLVKAAGETAFDADGALLDALLYTARHTPSSGSDGMLMAICDATYEICRFMGIPSFVKKGNVILGYLLYPQFSKRVHDYAKKTLDRIIEEKL